MGKKGAKSSGSSGGDHELTCETSDCTAKHFETNETKHVPAFQHHTVSPEEVLQIRFMHAKVCPYFSGCGRLIEDTLREIREGKLKASALPRIVVMVNDLVQSAGGKGSKSGKNKKRSKGKRRRGRGYDSEDEEIEEGASERSADQPRYFSLNNRRLYVFKELAKEGLLPPLRVRARFLSRESAKQQRKYSAARCSLWAKFDESLMRQRPALAEEEGEGGGGAAAPGAAAGAAAGAAVGAKAKAPAESVREGAKTLSGAGSTVEVASVVAETAVAEGVAAAATAVATEEAAAAVDTTILS